MHAYLLLFVDALIRLVVSLAVLYALACPRLDFNVRISPDKEAA